MFYVGIGIVFLLLVTTTTSFRTQRSRQLVLLGASYVLYAAFGLSFLAILVASSIFNFCIGVWLHRRPTLGRLWIGITFNLALLGFVKYLPFVDSFATIAMPVGISFWTFQALSYLLDLYHEDDLDPSLTEFCLYMAFWPTVIMGPICRLEKLLPQFRKIDDLSGERLTDGMRRIATGLMMKLVFAQLLVPVVATGFDGSGTTMRWSGFDVWILALGFGFQLYFDFAGYSHIVIGAARLIGFELEENFDSPYLSATPSIFWTRWHMSLSSWIRDYVFMPLSTVRRETWWRYFAVLSSMIILDFGTVLHSHS
jgi:D-alanyl-lipoteichoic acid acyltransferase DltB (MBOAT superfamily)